jgi:hypothetical protein
MCVTIVVIQTTTQLVLFSLSSSVWLSFSLLADCLLLCYRIEISITYNSSLNYFQVDPNHKYGEIDSTYEEICSSGLMDVGCSGQCVEIHT